MSAINGVIITPLKKIPDERGCIMHMLRNDSPVYEKFGEIYFSIAYPGVIKGWHEHTLQVQNYCVVSGMIKLVLFDNRQKSSTYKKLMELFIGDQNYSLVTIPTGVINGYKCIGTASCMVANCSTLPYQDGEMLRYDPFGDVVPYQWPIEMK
jgi:dTDP-4-dehydrorhamnose 3,5-epimerase